MNKIVKQLVDTLDQDIATLKRHMAITNYSEADLREIRKAVKEREKALHRLAKTGMRGNFVEHPPLASLPARTPYTALKEGLGYAVEVSDNAVQIGKVRITKIIQRPGETLYSWEGIPPLYVARSSSGVLFHSQPRQSNYLVQIPAGQKSIRGFPVGMFKR